MCCINVNNMLTDWFQTYSGVIQGDIFSPTLFNIFINDLVDDVNSLNLGVTIDGHRISILLYADDIVLKMKLKKILKRCLTLFTNGVRNTKSNLLLENQTLFTSKISDYPDQLIISNWVRQYCVLLNNINI